MELRLRVKKKSKTRVFSQPIVTKPGLILRMKAPVPIPGNNQSTYICYEIPYDLPMYLPYKEGDEKIQLE